MNVKQSDTYEFEYYLDDINAKHIAAELYRAAVMYFSSISKIQKFAIYDKFFESCKRDDIWDLWEKPEVKEIFQESLMDQIKVGICFENFMKGLLLEKGYLVHKIKAVNDSTNFESIKHLQNKQFGNKEPIEVNEFISIEGFTYNERTRRNSLKHLTNNTITYSNLLEYNKYQELIKLDDQLIKILRKNRDRRNSLHFTKSLVVNLSKDDREEWKNLTIYVNELIISRYNKIIADMGQPKKNEIAYLDLSEGM